MKFFLDTANIESIKKAVVQEIAHIVKGPISVEGVGQTKDEIVKEGLEFAKWAPNIVVKIPITKEGLSAVKYLETKGIRTNVTLVFSVSQAILAAKAGASYVSPFVGRLDDVGQDGMILIRDVMEAYRNYGYKSEVIVASIRSLKHVEESAKFGAHIATIHPAIFDKMFEHELTTKGIAKFLEDNAKNKR